jgi:DNA-binding transcriptional regulator YiaG
MQNKRIHYTICGLNYVYIDVPTGVDPLGNEYIDVPVEVLEKSIAAALIEAKVPLRGREILFLRKALAMNRNDWAKLLDVTASAILSWEKDHDKRLSRINEMAIRALCSEKLGVHLRGDLSDLIGVDTYPEKLLVSSPKAA